MTKATKETLRIIGVSLLIAIAMLAVAALCGGCAYKGAKVVEGTDLAVGLYVPVSEGDLQLNLSRRHQMTEEQQASLKRELDGAMASGDYNRIRCAQSNILLALMDCQRKTADRVKQLKWKLFVFLSGGGTALDGG